VSIKFICSCGKHLRARDEMAARRSMCPRCGAPVGIPALQPTHAGTVAAPLTPQERRRLQRGKSSDELFAAETTTILVPPISPFADDAAQAPRPLPRRQLEQHSYQCLAYPLFSGRLQLVSTAALTLLSGSLILSIPEWPRLAALPLKQLLFLSPCLLGSLLILGYVCGSLECALTSALAGQGPGMYWLGWSLDAALKSGLRWLLCFLAGPSVFLGLAFYYWLNGGDLTVLDWLIVGELGVLAMAYWFLAIVSANESNRLRDANPARVAQLIHRLRYRAAVPVFVAPALLSAHALLGVFAATTLHRHPFTGWLLLAMCWCSGLYCATALFRLLGVWCYRAPAAGAGP
jgi:hypothetical protein